MPRNRREYLRAYQREWIKRRRLTWFKENGPCVDCGSAEDLELDHVDRSTKITHSVWSWALERRTAELAKCVVRCRPCHLAKTRRDVDRGEAVSHSKLTEVAVRDIRAQIAEGHSQVSIARQYGVHKATVNDIYKKKSWAWLE